MTPENLEPGPTEDWARTLLHRAAETVEVDPAGPLDLPTPKPLWPLLAAAAAVLAVATATAVFTLGGGSTPPVVTPRVDSVPSVFGYTAAQAAAMLEGEGFAARIVAKDTCETKDRAVGTSPPAGSGIGAGDEVVVFSSTGDAPNAFCANLGAPRVEAWEFLDFANGRGPAPAFAQEVTLWVNGVETTSLTATQATDLASWGDGSALARLAEDSRAVKPSGKETMTPTLRADRLDHAEQFSCGGSSLPRSLRQREALVLSVEFPERGPVGDCAFVFVFRHEGLIDAVALQTMDFSDDAVNVPAVVGLKEDGAREILEAAGFRIESHITQVSACADPGQVLAQDPAAGALATRGATVTLDVTGDSGGECGLDLPPADEVAAPVAELFARFARGERPPHGPPVDTPVDLYLGNRYLATLPAARARDPEAWEGCLEGGYAGRTCPFSWTRPIADYAGRLAITSAAPEHPCAHPGPLPAELEAYHAVTLTPDESLDCTSYWAVQLFVNDVGQVVAANLVWAEP
jgi:hypothetical protein